MFFQGYESNFRYEICNCFHVFPLYVFPSHCSIKPDLFFEETIMIEIISCRLKKHNWPYGDNCKCFIKDTRVIFGN
jgi:hypothetical protein